MNAWASAVADSRRAAAGACAGSRRHAQRSPDDGCSLQGSGRFFLAQRATVTGQARLVRIADGFPILSNAGVQNGEATNRLLKIAQSAAHGADVRFCREPYGKRDIRFLQDVIAMVNAAAEGPRYIVIGAVFGARGKTRLHSVDLDDVAGKPAWQALATDVIGPLIRLQYRPVTVDGKRLGVR